MMLWFVPAPERKLRRAVVVAEPREGDSLSSPLLVILTKSADTQPDWWPARTRYQFPSFLRISSFCPNARVVRTLLDVFGWLRKLSLAVVSP